MGKAAYIFYCGDIFATIAGVVGKDFAKSFFTEKKMTPKEFKSVKNMSKL